MGILEITAKSLPLSESGTTMKHYAFATSAMRDPQGVSSWNPQESLGLSEVLVLPPGAALSFPSHVSCYVPMLLLLFAWFPDYAAFLGI